MQSTRNDEPAGLASKNKATDEYSSMASSKYPPAPRFPAADYTAYQSEEADNAQPSGDQVTQINCPRKLITPAGYDLGPNEEGWHSERSSSSRYQPKFPPSTSPRRENRKANGLAPCLKVPMPLTKPCYDIVVEYQGLKLGRISDAVPSLLGPRTLLERIHIILEHKLEFAEPISPTSSNTSFPYSPRDRALIAILTSLRTLEYARRERGNWYPQGLATKHDALRVYRQSAKNGDVKPVYLSLADFLDKAAGANWQGGARADGVGAVDQGYNGFSAGKDMNTTSATSATTTTASSASAGVAQGHVPTTPTPTPATSNAPDLYAKRFTHAYPLGRPRSLVSDEEKAVQRASVEASTTNAFSALQQQQQQQHGGGGGSSSSGDTGKAKRVFGCWTRSKKKRNQIFFIAFMALVFGAVLGVMLWGLGTSRWDFTAKAETG